jgi:hypothetical protein
MFKTCKCAVTMVVSEKCGTLTQCGLHGCSCYTGKILIAAPILIYRFLLKRILLLTMMKFVRSLFPLQMLTSTENSSIATFTIKINGKPTEIFI